MVLKGPLSSFESSDNHNRSSTVTFFGSQVDDDCDNETKDDDLPYFVNKVNGSDDNSGSANCHGISDYTEGECPWNEFVKGYLEPEGFENCL